ncbi:hypothetical protein HPC49_08485 [Pyxidicoccus fallax]|uniref:Lipoprotein n=1 Tax=Pyxidicoccus fallax TaxID=394095 RepID=A0A848LD57_9BACT|nr:hypothetical protein [Pyxidicoccus fallax]NMO13368.1 hypothetical protein [Pyxidicoccus fallax]NPC78286.1 hypothetical protein [Pyxidicoccus fallax]
MLHKTGVPTILIWSSLCLLMACDNTPRATEVIKSHGPEEGSAALVLLIERAGGEGPYVEGATEHFRVVTSDETFKSVRWSVSAGLVTPDSERVSWTLPPAGQAVLSVSVETQSGKTAEGAFTFNVVAASLAAGIAIDSGPDVTGSACELAFDNAGRGHLLYLNDTHRSLWYARWDGTTWTREQVDGPGFGTGGFISAFALALDAVSGTPHVAYLKGYGSPGGAPGFNRIWYATRVNGAWVTENTAPVNRSPNTRVSIALDPAQGLRPVIVVSDNVTSLSSLTRTAPNTWSPAIIDATSGTAVEYVMGDVAFDAAGTLYIPVTTGSGGPIYLTAVRGTTAESLRLEPVDLANRWLPMVWGPGNHLLMLASGGSLGARMGLLDITVASPFSASTYTAFPVDNENDASDLAYAGKLFIAHRHGTALELITPDARNLWTYTQIGTAQSSSRPSIAVRPTTGVAHVCYQRDDKVSFQ